MKLVNIGIAGCLGRMGRELVKKSSEDSRINFVGGFEHPGHNSINKNLSEILECETDKTVSSDAEEIFLNSDAIIDFTTPDSSLANIKLAQKTKTPLVIGTTGLSSETHKFILNASNQIALFQSSNMSLGVNLLFHLVKKTASTLDDINYDIEIAETHHRHKIDAPSGTAITLGEFASKGRKRNFNDIKVYDRTSKTSKRKTGEISFSVTRGGEIPGEHTVSFIGENDRIDLSHKAFNRSIFVNGAIEAALFLSKKKTGLYHMEDIIKV
ncbi:MAG: 4-hydroxy-tetrahydrodipicolinate reductase [Pelagibacteraceae bacterium]|jgi:4-hydroxy-tetrahydrodipicolinate reductase|nr:4-hydroxy-tetrahydrodipicolinate reductase [Pelagibacteraceae bacterium]MDP6783870.1 4-hydroxy-tetrahydrodipicolinate reductase [Alphaproteobacteria bacterium]MBO6467848.1 4-hydroxy-tetrahydrodipicolinate reductase [Pelagibacteraceae bacterium]MBO6468540.1 4-hydroxy-tetrahydrodipicolinate reductase [Pelagibacteraceae bacterium]MBO6469864.1 4-hydroxy-tetrahydrodipicolinate reductase [Pelagibacteraceae bacterium]